MYTRGCTAAAAGCTATLPLTGVSIGWSVIAGATLLIAGLALVRLAPVIRRRPQER
ncbi:hypothetical protein K7640_10995 [Micromonospora sp. PLK6-60]|uniref:hypothetical protein n=1 Tax=Micromonospora sp. PLK6-60 TaxID=2873383 RepID=UPI001CA66A44|nr:hypothetical protein [Micromonospora sp. PLK6-60]MBY8872366.1 hypothetical protein [Micromonospora sp. PLK6-60]